jgi:serine/threonine protein phosphatase PrpC
VSRAFGDPDFKTPGVVSLAPFIWPEGHDQIFTADLITAEPEFVQETISADDNFMLLACDGIWDVLTAEEAIRFIAQVRLILLLSVAIIALLIV